MLQCWELCSQYCFEAFVDSPTVKIFEELAILPVKIQFCNDASHWLQILGRDEENDILKTTGDDPYFFQCSIIAICGIQLIL